MTYNSTATNFLRKLIFTKTGNNSLDLSNLYPIKNSPHSIDHLLPEAPEDLSTIYPKYRHFFSALKQGTSNPDFFDRLSYLRTATREEIVNIPLLQRELHMADFFTKSVLATSFMKRGHQEAFHTVYESMVLPLHGKTFYLPRNVTYTLPTGTHKFFGSVPIGTVLPLKDIEITCEETLITKSLVKINDKSWGSGQGSCYYLGIIPHPDVKKRLRYTFRIGRYKLSSILYPGKGCIIGLVMNNQFRFTSLNVKTANMVNPSHKFSKVLNHLCFYERYLHLEPFLTDCGAVVTHDRDVDAMDLTKKKNLLTTVQP